MSKMSDQEKQQISNELNSMIQDFESTLSSNPTKDKIESIYITYKPRMQELCARYQGVDLPEIDAFEFHSSYSEEYKDCRKEEYLDLSKFDRELYKSYVMASNYEYLILETIDWLSGEEVKKVGRELIENLMKVFEEMNN
jgi:hypothetical protein